LGVSQGPGYPLQVLALPSSGCGLSTSIPHANRKVRKFILKSIIVYFEFFDLALGKEKIIVNFFLKSPL
jgi:hypothetical protein